MSITYRPETLTEALTLISEGNKHILAGGTDLMIRKRNISGADRTFINDVVLISHLDELNGVNESEKSFEILAGTTQEQMAYEQILPEYIRKVYFLMGNPAIRNVATIGGNLVNAASVGDTIPLYWALDAKVELRSSVSSREMNIASFITSKYKTAINPGELLYSVTVPKLEFDGYFYKKLGTRKASILSKISLIILYRVNDGKLTDLRVCAGAVNDLPIRSRKLEESFMKDMDVEKFVVGFLDLSDAKDDKRSTKSYREKVLENMVRQELERIKGLCTI